MSRIGDSRRVHDDEPRFGLIRQLPEEVTEPTSMNRTCFRSAESAEAHVRTITGIRADGSQILSFRIQLVEQRMDNELVSGHVFQGDIGSTSLVRQLASDMYLTYTFPSSGFLQSFLATQNIGRYTFWSIDAGFCM